MINRTLLSKSTFKTDCIDFFSMTRDIKISHDSLDKNSILRNLYVNHKKTAIYTSHNDAVVLRDNFLTKSKLITISQGINKNHSSSVFGNHILESIGYTKKKVSQKFIDENNGKYVAKLAGVFHLSSNHIEIWNKFCTNGLFNIWNPAAPYNRLNKKEHQVNSFKYNFEHNEYDVNEEEYMYKNQLPSARILLLRIFELNEEDRFKYDDIKIQSRQYDSIEPKDVLLDNPLINDPDFELIYNETVYTLDQLKKSIDNFDYFGDCGFKKIDSV